MPKRAVALGGVFFRSADPKRLAAWYKKHLGLRVHVEGRQVYALFPWQLPNGGRSGYTVWAPFPAKTWYFGSRQQALMLNYVVEDLAALLKALRKERVKVVRKIQETKYGRFAWVEDPEGHRIELWEPLRA